MNDQVSNINRRRFLGETSCASLGSIAALSTIFNLRLTGSLAAADDPPDEDYKALVCVFLAGGNDSFNMLTPSSGGAYNDYSAARGNLALLPGDLTSFSQALSDGRQLGLNSNMSELLALYEGGSAAFVANVGTLVEQTTVASVQDGSARLPLGLFSHSDQQLHWQSGLPDTRSPGSGWAGRLGDNFEDLNGVSGVSMNISTAGTNLFQSSAGTAVFSKSPGKLPGIKDWNTQAAIHLARRQAIESVLDAEYQNVFERAFTTKTKEAIAAGQEYGDALAAADPVTSPFTASNPISMQLKDVAEGISARAGLNKKRQTFFVSAGGWDHHASLDPHPAMLAQLSQAIGEFQAAMAVMCLEDKVTLFTASDFGRTLSENGGGSDHAWGGNQVVVGGAVNGKQVYGEYPDLALGSSLDTGRGRLVPTTSVDEYFAELALWMGVSKSNLPLILPNIGRFYDADSESPPLGLMDLG
ncbi:DUF1501 domain-containing protein [Akkermansiaceae bacterium]|nr:DUF1501 domain-containing protein [Akkermansiaceae bacterium]MDB4537908.1 DUF1501 domain-containing protein [Akkermansiaceae bacterium]